MRYHTLNRDGSLGLPAIVAGGSPLWTEVEQEDLVVHLVRSETVSAGIEGFTLEVSHSSASC